MLTPAETTGLLGKQIDGRLRRAAERLSTATLRDFASRLHEDAWRNHVVYERDGTAEAVRIMLRPLAATDDQIAYVHHVCSVLTDALRRLADLYLSDPDVRHVLALDPTEASWLSQLWSDRHGRNNPIYGRLDAVCDFSSPDWRDALAFLEPNLSGIGGIHYAPVVERLVMRDVVPEMSRYDPALRLELPRDQRELFMQALIEHAESIGRRIRTLAFIEPKYAHSGPDEQRVLAEFIESRYGCAVVHVDPRDLTIVDGEVHAQRRAIDLAYRDYEVRDLIALERAEGVDMAPMRRLFAENRIVSSIAGDFDHKSCWELLTDPALAHRHFAPEALRLFEKHVLWTRIVRPRRTRTWDQRDIELVPFALEHREQLVLKPNRSCGGVGVCIGAATDAERWRQRIDEALSGADDPHRQWVVQRAAPIPVFEFPTVDDAGNVSVEPFYTVMGFAATEHGLGVMCRVSQRQVVNVAQRGGIAAVLVARGLDAAPARRGGQVRSSGARQTFREHIATIKDLDGAIGLLGWDEETHLPSRGHAERGAQLATLESLRHQSLLDAELFAVASELVETHRDDVPLQREIAIYLRLHRIAQALPDTLVKAFARARSTALAAWEAARSARDFGVFVEPFATLLELVRERGQALSIDGDPYDGLLDEHEPGLTRGELEPILRTLAGELVPSIRVARRRDPDVGATWPAVDAATQRRWVETLLERMGFDFQRGRLDRSSHPFTLAAGAHDVRLTMRARAGDPLATLFAALHEGGHGLYDQGFPAELAGTLLADAPSTGMHEAQARLWENHVGRSLAFWRGFAPVVAPALGAGADAETLYRLVNRVEPGLVRVGADELTYNLHIVLRTELEILLIGGHVTPTDLPEVWREKSLRYLGKAPPDDLVGCLQDVHWALGSFGYFPSYTLGDLYAAMLWEKLERDVPNADDALASGDLAPIGGWLRSAVHVNGALASADGTIRQVTGQPLSAASFLNYVAKKFAA